MLNSYNSYIANLSNPPTAVTTVVIWKPEYDNMTVEDLKKALGDSGDHDKFLEFFKKFFDANNGLVEVYFLQPNHPAGLADII